MIIRKSLILLVLLIVGVSVYAEDKVAEYTSSYFKNVKHDIRLSDSETTDFTFYIDCEPLNKGDLGFYLEWNDVTSFVLSLLDVRLKYSLLNIDAKNLTENFATPIDVNFSPVSAYFMHDNEWRFDTSVELIPLYLANKDGDRLIVFRVAELTAYDDENIKSEGFYLVFASTDEIDNFRAGLSLDFVVQKKRIKAGLD